MARICAFIELLLSAFSGGDFIERPSSSKTISPKIYLTFLISDISQVIIKSMVIAPKLQRHWRGRSGCWSPLLGSDLDSGTSESTIVTGSENRGRFWESANCKNYIGPPMPALVILVTISGLNMVLDGPRDAFNLATREL